MTSNKDTKSPALRALYNEKMKYEKNINITEKKVRDLRNEHYKIMVAIRALESPTKEITSRDFMVDVLGFIETERKSVDSIFDHLRMLDRNMTRSNVLVLIDRMRDEGLLTSTGRGQMITPKGGSLLSELRDPRDPLHE